MEVILAGSLDLLSVNPGLVIWTVITFTLVLIVLWAFAWKPLINALDQRGHRIEEDLEKSRKLREEAEALLKDYEAKLDSAKAEALEIVEEGRKDAEALRNKLLKEAEDEAGRIRERVGAELEQTKLKALEEIENRSVELAEEIVARVFKRGLSDADHKKLVLHEVSELQKNSTN